MTDSLKPSAASRHTRGRHYWMAAFIGVAVGLFASAFRLVLTVAETARVRLVDHLHAVAPHIGWTVPVALGIAAGAAVGGLLTLAPEAGGSGIPHLKAVLLGLRKLESRWLIPVKFVGGVLGIGAGLSLGREGPTVQMGAALAQKLARWLDVPSKAVPQLLSCGAGAGLAASFNAPLAGVIFVIEELHRELSSRTFMGALIAAVIATAVADSLTGQVPTFEIRNYPMLPLWALPGAAVVGLAGGLLGVALNRCVLDAARATAHQQTIPRWTLPAIGGAIVGLVGWWLPAAIGGGHAPAEQLLGGRLTLTLLSLAVTLVARFVMTVMCYASGAPGGIFAPMLLMGALLGTAFGRFGAYFFPAGLANNGQAFAVLGMAAVFTGSIRAPLTGIVLICELTANYDQLFALCITCLCAHGVAECLGAAPIYDSLMEADLHRSGVTPMDEARTIYLGVQRNSPLAGVQIRHAGLPKGTLITEIERSGRAITPLADVELHAGDHISVSIAVEKPEIALKVADLCMPAE